MFAHGAQCPSCALCELPGTAMQMSQPPHPMPSSLVGVVCASVGDGVGDAAGGNVGANIGGGVGDVAGELAGDEPAHLQALA